RLGALIRAQRILRQERQRDLASRVRISLTTLGAAERGDPSVSGGVYATLIWAVGLAGLSTAAEHAAQTAEQSGLLPSRVRHKKGVS
ncbi:MAG: helix-turn-helix domain-containing protein, partial [Nevskiales bacterium]